MKIPIIAVVGAVGVFLSSAALAGGGEVHSGGSKVHWGYEGEAGPAHWAELSPNYAACKGSKQSPIDLNALHKADNEDIKLIWQAFAPDVLNNGHAIEASTSESSVTRFSGKEFKLLQVHFHHLSEHTIKGKHSALEAHFVHKGADGSLLVFGVMIDQGSSNSEIAKIWEVAPHKKGKAKAKQKVDFSRLVPSRSKYYRYAGSLTTPPCSEIVNWVVFSTPIRASKEQIEEFAKLYESNNRPVQPINGRFVVFGN